MSYGGPDSYEARLALEHWRASGPRTRARLDELVTWACTVSAINNPDTCDAMRREAQSCAHLWEVTS